MKRKNSMKVQKVSLMSLCLLLVLGNLITIRLAYSAEEPLLMGIFPRRNALITHELYRPLAKYLSVKLNRKVKLVTTKDFKSFWKNVTKKKYDIVHYNQYHYIISHKKYGYRVILKNEEFGKSTIAGSIVVRKDSGIHSVKDLKGKTVVFGGGPKAMQSYIVARYLLEQNGLAHGNYQEKFSINPPNAIFAAFYKQSAAAGAGDVILNLDVVTKKIDAKQMKYLLQGPQLVHLPWAVKPSMSTTLSNTIQSLLSKLHKTTEGKKLLKKAKLSGLIIANDDEFDGHRKIVKTVYNEDY